MILKKFANVQIDEFNACHIVHNSAHICNGQSTQYRLQNARIDSDIALDRGRLLFTPFITGIKKRNRIG